MSYDFKPYQYKDRNGKIYNWEVIDNAQTLLNSIFGMFAGVSSCHFCGKTPSGNPSAKNDVIILVGQMFTDDGIMIANGICHKCEAEFMKLSLQDQLTKLETAIGKKQLKFEVNLRTMSAREIKEPA